MNEIVLRLFALVLFIAYRTAIPGNDGDMDLLKQNKAYFDGLLESAAKYSDN